jgi:hypothetical protein
MGYMFDVTHKYKGGCVFFATVRLNEDHSVYLSAYGELASGLLEKYVEDQRADNEDLFAEWDKSLEKARSQVGFAATHEVEGGYVFISTFQSGIGISPEDMEPKRQIIRVRRELGREMSEMEDDDE